MVFEFGSNGFFGYAAVGPETTMWWSTCQAEQVPEDTKISAAVMQEQLKKRHGHWKDPVIQECIGKSTVSQIYPTWTTPDLPTWSSNGLVILGDAAHALHPTSGQGASMALEDSQCLGLLLTKYLVAHAKDPEKLPLHDVANLTGESLYALRSLRLRNISDRAKMISKSKKDLPFAVEMMMCGMMWLMGKVPFIGECCALLCFLTFLGKMLMGDVMHQLYYEWDAKKATKEDVGKRLSERK